MADHHISVRTQRAPVLAGACLSLLLGLGVLQLLGAPLQLTVMILSVLAGILAVLAVNLVWKLSAHAAVASFFMIAMVMIFGWVGLVSAVVPLAVGWSRVRLGAHTTLQVLAGLTVGLLIGAGFMALMVY
ncbi:phosphatidic acid phosphatase [Arthrobacter sp. EH-1B-1]|uniref:Phosphatidic acid phosphatase n=1 Tax=Arthrobacter vasquezii TaxID=2977629 RepID=A0ABT6CYE0_9MICC|nr:phosphatidic acid phosphatase [Arthrobacter vasquezii]MDF9279086.1 phosphatidic acid phosphatase [Arthrobacter vasquezii]